MPLQKLTKAELADTAAKPRGGPPAEYVSFLRRLRPGEVGRAVLADEGATRITVKSRLSRAAEVAGVGIKFLRSSADECKFEATGKL